PGVLGQLRDAAQSRLAAAELQLGSVTARESDADPAGTVLEQTPPAGTVVNEGTPVDVVVATPPTVTVPEVLGETEDGAKALLKRLGLSPQDDARVEQQSDRPKGTVLASLPPPGARVPKGTAVALTVAVPLRVRVPDVRGRTPATAALMLGSVGLS